MRGVLHTRGAFAKKETPAFTGVLSSLWLEAPVDTRVYFFACVSALNCPCMMVLPSTDCLLLPGGVDDLSSLLLRWYYRHNLARILQRFRFITILGHVISVIGKMLRVTGLPCYLTIWHVLFLSINEKLKDQHQSLLTIFATTSTSTPNLASVKH